MASLEKLQEISGVAFRNPALLQQALLHSSFCHENPALAVASNERLEFLGDAILGLIIAEKLYRNSPTLTEGEMTRLRSVLVRRETLARVARKMNLGEYQALGKGEEVGGGRDKPANLAAAFEAVIAAVYLDRGLAIAREFVLKWLGEELGEVVQRGGEINYKSQLQEVVQSRQQLIPSYRVVDAVGPDHDRRFTVEVVVGDTVLGRGSGKSKKAAEMEAARQALQQF